MENQAAPGPLKREMSCATEPFEDMKDQDREVCGAFVMFETEELKDAVVNVCAGVLKA